MYSVPGQYPAEGSDVTTFICTFNAEGKLVGVDKTGSGGSRSEAARGREQSADPVKVDDLVGARASSGESELQTRGFRHVDSLQSGTTSYTIWFNGRTHQCLQVATAEGRYDSVTDIHEHAKCR
jgi:hypothetical protein